VPPSERDLDALMARLADGDRSAFEPLFRALWPRALAAARRRLEPHAADDAAQSTMTKLFARAAEFEGGRPVLPWFYAIAANEIRTVVRRAKPAVGLDEAPPTALATVADPESASIERELREALARAIDALDGPSAEAIASVLGDRERPAVEAAAFRKRVSRAYAKLRTALGGHGER
jgi:RNA polymerase sigma-70 factor (ECF subfamily)